MPPGEPFHHRPTLKQTNRSFKSRHATKGSIKAKNKGKVERTDVVSRTKSSRSTKADRRNAAKLEQKKKRELLTQENRFFQGASAPPKLVAVVPLCPDVSTEVVVEHLAKSGGATVLSEGPSPVLRLEQFKQKVQLVQCRRDLVEIIDAAKVVDYVIYVLSAVVEVDDFGKMCLSAVAAQGVVTPLAIVQHLNSVPSGKRQDIKRSLQLFMEDRFPGEQRLFSLDSAQDCGACLRAVANTRSKAPLWRERHSYLVPDQLQLVKSADGDPTGTLRVTGFVRGQPMSANRLVHVVGVGTFQLQSIEAAQRPDDRRAGDVEMAPSLVLAEPDPEAQESLASENEVDPMAGEQTWPTEEELRDGEQRQNAAMADGHDGAAKRKRRVPKGTSAYQAEWILDDSEDDADDEDGGSEDDDMVDGDGASNGRSSDGGSDDEEEEHEMIELEDGHAADSDGDDGSYEDLDDEDAYGEYLKKKEEQRQDAQFPDEVNTPRDVDARVRFQKYRGLKSFRTSPWDPTENLPVDYSRIFQFENFSRTRHRMLKQVGSEGVEPGTYVTLNIRDFPADAVDLVGKSGLVGIFSLLPHENKTSLVNMVVTKTSEYEEPVKSKDQMLVQLGFRRFWASPIYSTDTRGGVNNVHKYERFLQPGRPSMASAYLPIQFGPAPVLFLRSGSDGADPALVATGTVLEADPLRIVAKRIILTGHPFKIHKRSVVVRYMFWNAQDIAWFRPVQLVTKLGRTGHIQDSIGTHGHMKCQFDGPVKPQDTVCMYLYKRQFPKWNSRPAAAAELIGHFAKQEIMMEL
ncbi:hypothetical protein DFJ74DRAFT_671178 [Hyaloraphidium curvatum]|nr:hypothetical protein DFJ74DRAFT_671178 [Hyaloraphidium curvatum]